MSFALIFSLGDIEIERLGYLDFALLGLATFRLIHLITYDRILDFARGCHGQGRQPVKSRRARVAPGGL
jgi:hypothetical protein